MTTEISETEKNLIEAITDSLKAGTPPAGLEYTYDYAAAAKKIGEVIGQERPGPDNIRRPRIIRSIHSV
jgi:hypothetical protein